MSDRVCTEIGCSQPMYLRGLCRKDYREGMQTGKIQRLWRRDESDEDKMKRFWSTVAITADDERCWEWQGSSRDGYGWTSFKGKPLVASALAWFFTHGKFPEQWMLHKCDNPPCVNPKHLFEGTHADNMRDKAQKGRCGVLKGEQSNFAKLTKADVLSIRQKISEGVPRTMIAKMFNVNYKAIWNINTRRTWAHI